MKPTIISTLIAVRLGVIQQEDGQPKLPVSEYLVSIGGKKAFSAFGVDGEANPKLTAMLKGADFAQVFVPSEYSKSEVMEYWTNNGFVKGKLVGIGSVKRTPKTVAAQKRSPTNRTFTN